MKHYTDGKMIRWSALLNRRAATRTSASWSGILSSVSVVPFAVGLAWGHGGDFQQEMERGKSLRNRAPFIPHVPNFAYLAGSEKCREAHKEKSSVPQEMFSFLGDIPLGDAQFPAKWTPHYLMCHSSASSATRCARTRSSPRARSVRRAGRTAPPAARSAGSAAPVRAAARRS